MDCEKFEKVVLDLMYQELDELGAAGAQRHLDQCARCREIHARLRATRDIGVLPLQQPPQGFEQRVLAAEALLRSRLPARQRLGRAVSKLADYAMRPQLAMAALLMLMIGSSLIFLRAKPGEQSSVQVTERGMPEVEADSIILPAPSETAPAKLAREQQFAPAPNGQLAQATAAAPPPASLGAEAKPESRMARAKSANEAESSAKRSAGGPGQGFASSDEEGLYGLEAKEPNSAELALQQARELQQSSGCAAAAPRFDEVSARFPATSAAAEATWRAAECRRLLGDVTLARQGYTLLLDVGAYRERARAALAQLGKEPAADVVASKPSTSSPRAGAAAAEAAPPPPAKAKSAPAAAPPPGN